MRDAGMLDALRKCSDGLLGLFADERHERIAPDILQPADVFLDRYGEEIRGRTYVFTDPGGRELCLRPDLTVPACRVYLDRYPEGERDVRYCYHGSAFRYQRDDGGRPREFEQAGVEWFGGEDRHRADVDMLDLACRALRSAGLERFDIRMGDLALFSALLDDLDIPARWRVRLRQRFWRPQAFRVLLERLAGRDRPFDNESHRRVLEAVDGLPEGDAIAEVDRILGERDVPLVGGRSIEEVAVRLCEQAADAREEPLDDRTVGLIRDYLAIEGPSDSVTGPMRELIGGVGARVDTAIDAYSRRLDDIAATGLDPAAIRFASEFGRNLEYYTGFVFQCETRVGDRTSHVAGGGRYDNMLADLGAPRPVPAIGLAIHMERLVAASGEGAG